MGVQEVWLVDRARQAVEVFVLRGDAYLDVEADGTGKLRAPALGLHVQMVGPKLRVAWPDRTAEV